MRRVEVTDRASAMVGTYRDERYTNQAKADLLDVVCSVIDDAEASGTISREDLRILSAISDLNDLITALSETRD